MKAAPKRPRQHPERDLERACSDLLELDGWRALKTDPVSDRATVQAIRQKVVGLAVLRPTQQTEVLAAIQRAVRGKGFGEMGMADCLYIRYQLAENRAASDSWRLGHTDARLKAEVQVVWIEFKSPCAKARPHQLAWIAAERARGALVLLAGVDFPATIEGFVEWYAASGLMRNNLTMGARK